ncbi:MAG: ATP-binding protein [Verrucomicrobia bacterium]|nr:ATP-binding protein [Verrucomicrobiota bacterium]
MKKDPAFIGRERELALLKELLASRIAHLVVIKGRRRIGKSRLTEEFGKLLSSFYFLGLAPQEGTSAQSQRDHFAHQMKQQLPMSSVQAEDWDDLFVQLAHHTNHHTNRGQVLLVFDEINWMGSRDPTFLPKLKTAWDRHFSKNSQLILILSGSMSAWIEHNILSSTGFFGRVSLDLTLDELSLAEAAQFWGERRHLIAPYELFKVLSVIGGVPRYLELINPKLTAEENLSRMCFRREGVLFDEFDRIFSDLFSRRNAIYKKIVQQTSTGQATLEEIAKGIGHPSDGTLSSYLEDLVTTGYLARDYTWDLKSGKPSKLSRYRLCDNYLRFYLRYIEPKREAILRSGEIPIPSWYTIMGLQFENLVLKNRTSMYKLLGIHPSEVVYDNSFFQTKTARRAGCQFDFLIQTRFNTLYACEIKFSRTAIGKSVVTEMKEKLKRLSLPQGFSVRPVLIHVNGISEIVEELEFFAHVIDFCDFLRT